jgi:hypothetical protein
MKTYVKIVWWVFIYLGCFGFVLPELISTKSNITLALGVFIILVLIYRTIMFLPLDKIKLFIKELLN